MSIWAGDQRRLRDGARGAAMEEPTADTPQKEIRKYLGRMHESLCAMQSLDDLGSDEANKQAWDDMIALERKYARAKALLREPDAS